MQLICEAYFVLKQALGLTNDELYDVFAEWNRGELDSYLIEITRDIFSVKDPDTGDYLVDMILDTAGAKGTGKWMSQLALDLGVPSTLVTEAVYARCLSAHEGRPRAGEQGAARARRPSSTATSKQFIEAGAAGAVRLEDLQLRPRLRADAGGGQGARLAARTSATSPCCGAAAASFGRGSSTASRKPSTPTRSWKTCCWRRTSPRRSRRPSRPGGTWSRRPCSWAFRCRPSPRPWPTTTATASERLPANLLQAQRDYFGAHTYERTDKPGTFHTDWLRAAATANRRRSDDSIVHADRTHASNELPRRTVRPVRPGGRGHRRHRRAGRRAWPRAWRRPAPRWSSPAAMPSAAQARVDAIEAAGRQGRVSAGRRQPAASRSKPCWPPRSQQHGRVDMLVNCAGVNSASAYLEVSDDDWDRVLDINLRGTHWGCQIFGRHMADQRRRVDPEHRQRHGRPAAVAGVRLLGLEGGRGEPDAERGPRVGARTACA